MCIVQYGRGSSRVRSVPDARAEARVVPLQRAGGGARRAGAAVPQARRQHAAHALQCKGDTLA